MASYNLYDMYMVSKYTFMIINLSVKVGQHLQSMYGEGIMVSQSTICRFEKLEITAQQVEIFLYSSPGFPSFFS